MLAGHTFSARMALHASKTRDWRQTLASKITRGTVKTSKTSAVNSNQPWFVPFRFSQSERLSNLVEVLFCNCPIGDCHKQLKSCFCDNVYYQANKQNMHGLTGNSNGDHVTPLLAGPFTDGAESTTKATVKQQASAGRGWGGNNARC